MREGDRIYINAKTCRIELKVSDAEIEQRLAELPPFEPKVKRGWLARYCCTSPAPTPERYSKSSRAVRRFQRQFDG